MKQEGEPSVEEILESIKKVMAGDHRAEAPWPGGPPETRDPGGAPPASGHFDDPYHDDDGPRPVLELTDAFMAPAEEVGNREPWPPAEPPAEYRGGNELQGREDSPDDPAPQAAPADEAPPPSPQAEAPLVAETARASMRETLAALAMLAEPGASTQIGRSGEPALERVARDLLRPMLAEWLDKNLPPLVEKLVAAEIAGILGKRG